MASKKRLKLQCPYCEKLYDVTEVEAGTRVVCQDCDHTMVVPNKQSTRKIPEALLRKVQEERDASAGAFQELELEKGPKEKADDEDGWIDWGSIKKQE